MFREAMIAAAPATSGARAATWCSGRPSSRATRRGVLGAARRQFRDQARRAGQHHRPQRRRQDDPAQDPVAHHRADRGPGRDHGAGRQPARGRHRLPSRADRPREHLPERRHPRHDAGPRCDARFDEIVEFSGVEKFIDTPVKRYSVGMYARLAFAVAAHLEAEILVIDEVLAVGDAEFQARCLNRMSEVADAAGAPCCSSATTSRRSRR